MGWWKAEPAAEPAPLQPDPSSGQPPTHPPPTQSPADSPSSCPVDPRARAIWLQQASKAKGNTKPQGPPPAKPLSAPASSSSSSQSTRRLSHERATSSIPRTPSPFPNPTASPSTSASASANATAPCNSEVETGTSASGNWVYPSEAQFFRAILRKHDPSQLLPQNDDDSNDKDAGKHTTTAITAGRRGRGASPTSELADTIPAIIPIHNAVNERAWALVLGWEQALSAPARGVRVGGGECSGSVGAEKAKKGPSLLSFRGLGAPSASSANDTSSSSSSPSSSLVSASPAQADNGAGSPPSLLSEYALLLNPMNTLSPKARLNAFVGYQLPFDRHDWVVQRGDGERIEYVIDFYQGKGPAGGGRGGGPGLGFYLDVRPKLNTWEGWRTRGWGWWEGARRWRAGDEEDD